MLRAIVVDDEPAAVETLCMLLQQYCGDSVQVVGTAFSAAEARRQIAVQRPDVVFLDVEMPGENGFELLRTLPYQDLAVIFVTAYEHYAIQALRMSAVDYLLKPVNPVELRAAVERAWRQRQSQSDRLKVLLENYGQAKRQRIALPIPEGYRIVDIEEVLYCQSHGSYSYVVTRTERILTTRLLGQWEEMLSSMDFFRIHRMFLVNTRHIHTIRRSEEGASVVILSNGEQLPVSRRRFALLIEQIRQGG